MILIGLGSNLSHRVFGTSDLVLKKATLILSCFVKVLRVSSWYTSPPMDSSNQISKGGHPDYLNGVMQVESNLPPIQLLKLILSVEQFLGRDRSSMNRVIDLDLLCYRRFVLNEEELILPHPRLSKRSFVLLPMREMCPWWRHPASDASLADLISELPHEMAAKTQRYN